MKTPCIPQWLWKEMCLVQICHLCKSLNALWTNMVDKWVRLNMI